MKKINKNYYIQTRNSCLYGVKIFDGISGEHPLPYCQPNNSVDRYYYATKVTNILDGDLKICKSGFHFCLSFRDALAYKELIIPASNFDCESFKKYPRAYMIAPVYNVSAVGDVIFEQDMNHSKFVTNKLNLLYAVDNLMLIKAYNYYITSHVYNQQYMNASNRVVSVCELDYTIQTNDNQEITITNSENSFSVSHCRMTVFSSYDQTLKVINKTGYTQYVNRYGCYSQEIIPIPRHTTMEFKSQSVKGVIVK